MYCKVSRKPIAVDTVPEFFSRTAEARGKGRQKGEKSKSLSFDDYVTFVEKRARPKIACSPSWRGRIEFTMKMGDKEMMTSKSTMTEKRRFSRDAPNEF